MILMNITGYFFLSRHQVQSYTSVLGSSLTEVCRDWKIGPSLSCLLVNTLLSFKLLIR